MLFRPGSSRAALLGLDNLSLASLFAGFVRLIPRSSVNEAAAFQPPYFAALPRNFAPLPGSPSICGPTPSHGPTPEVIWSPGSVSRRSYYTPARFLSSVSASMPHLSPRILFPPPGGFVPINLPVRPPACAPVGASGPVGNWVESVEREDFIEMEEESFGAPTFIAPRPHRGPEFIVEESQSEQSPPPIVGVSARAKDY